MIPIMNYMKNYLSEMKKIPNIEFNKGKEYKIEKKEIEELQKSL